MKPTADDLRAAKELISEWEQVLHRASTDDAHTDLLNRIASMRASEREKAAKILDTRRAVFGAKSLIGDPYTRGLLDALEGAAAAIRANKE